MKRKKTGWYAIIAICMVSLLFGCSDQESLVPANGPSQVVLKASAETKSVSRSAISDEGVFSWLKNDKIDVYASDGAFHEFALTSGEGTNSADFTGTLVDGVSVEKFAVSPAGLNPTFDEAGSLKLTLPDSYTWAEKQTHALMLSKIERDNVLSFKNLGGLMKLYVRNIKNGCKIVVTSSSHQLAGEMVVSQDTEGIDVLHGVLANNNNVVTYTSSSKNEKQAFYLPLPIADGMELNVKVYDEKGEEKINKNAKLSTHRKELILMPSLTFPEAENAAVADVSSSENITAALDSIATQTDKKDISITINSNSNKAENEEASTTVEVAAPIEIPAVITAPSTGEGEGGEGGNEGEGGEGSEGGETPVATPTVKITFDEVPQATAATDNKVVLTDNQNVDEVESTESKSNVEVAIPEAPAGVEPPSFEISLPTTTVTLTATQETATFNEVWATTADNTLNVAKGVTVKNLHVLSGNVVVTGRIDNITNYSNKTVYVRVSGAGSVGNVSGDVSVIREGDDINADFENEDVADGQNIPYEIANLEQLRSLANRVEAARVNSENRPYADCYYVLTTDIDLGNDMLWKPIGTGNHSFAGIFDGDGHTITGILNMGECDNAGFFGRIHNNAIVKNLTIAADIQIISEDVTTSSVVGGFAGIAEQAIFENCHHTGNISIMTDYIGGFVGISIDTKYRLCSNTGDLTNLNTSGVVGGFVGEGNNSDLKGCYNTGDLSTLSGTCGGLVGQTNSGATITACWVSGNLTAKTKGGIFGSGNNYTIHYSYWANGLGVGGNGSWSPNSVDSFEGSAPNEDQIYLMNTKISSLGWKYKNDGTLVPMEANTLPSNPIKPW